jgi:hypothetical protein
MLTFVLTGPARIRFTVEQLSPVCQTTGRFSVLGHAGVNRVRFAGRVAGRQLKMGTYRITAETPAGQSLQRVKLVVVRAAPTEAELAALLASNACPSSVGSSAMGSTGAVSTGDPSGTRHVPSLSPAEPSGSSSTAPDSGGILGTATVEQAAQAIRPALVGLLVAAILLLGVASLPQLGFADPRINEALARHRLQIAGVGAGALVAVIVAFLLG